MAVFQAAFTQLFRAVERIRMQLETADPELRPFLAQELRGLRELSEQYMDYWMELEEQILELVETYQLQQDTPVAASSTPHGDKEVFLQSRQGSSRNHLGFETDTFETDQIDSKSVDPLAMDAADVDIAKAVFSWPEDVTVKFRRGLAYYDLFMFEPARAALEEVLSQVDSMIVRLYLAAVLAVEHRSEVARGHLTRVFAKCDDEAIVTAGLEIEAQLLLQEGDIQKACRTYQVITKRMPMYFDAWFNLGLCQANIGNYKAAEEAFARVVQDEPRDSEACLLLSSVQQYSSSLETAFHTCRSALDVSPGHHRLRLHQSRLLYQMGQVERSLEIALRLADEDLHDQRVLAWSAWLLLETGQSPAAIVRLKRFLSLHPNDPTVLLQLGVAYLLSAEPKSAEPVLWAALPNSRDKSMLWLALGTVSASKGAHLEAQKRFLRAVRDVRTPVRRLALYQYALSLQAMEQFDEAERYLHAAHVAGPPSAVILSALADNASQLGHTEEATKRRVQARSLAVTLRSTENEQKQDDV